MSCENSTVLRHCPFCGKQPELSDSTKTGIFDNIVEAFGYTVLCNGAKGGCGTTCGYWPTEEEAIQRWNTRFKEIPLEEECESAPLSIQQRAFLKLCTALELKDVDISVAMFVAETRISRLTAVQQVIEQILGNPEKVHQALTAVASQRTSPENVQDTLSAATQLITAERPDIPQ